MKVSELENEVKSNILHELGTVAKAILKEKMKNVREAEKLLDMLKADLEEFKASDVEDIDPEEHEY